MSLLNEAIRGEPDAVPVDPSDPDDPRNFFTPFSVNLAKKKAECLLDNDIGEFSPLEDNNCVGTALPSVGDCAEKNTTQKYRWSGSKHGKNEMCTAEKNYPPIKFIQGKCMFYNAPSGITYIVRSVSETKINKMDAPKEPIQCSNDSFDFNKSEQTKLRETVNNVLEGLDVTK